MESNLQGRPWSSLEAAAAWFHYQCGEVLRAVGPGGCKTQSDTELDHPLQCTIQSGHCHSDYRFFRSLAYHLEGRLFVDEDQSPKVLVIFPRIFVKLIQINSNNSNK
ncbi:hypothetical protein RB195_013796 [Necator americanus]|uniref:Uncharacterized protein n=1 Tax=Necator americanus TaxID=51031 RepID=A0ABR1DXA6_NECAM